MDSEDDVRHRSTGRERCSGISAGCSELLRVAVRGGEEIYSQRGLQGWLNDKCFLPVCQFLLKMSQKQYMIVNEGTGLVLDVNSSGDNVVMWAAHGGNNQRFIRDGPLIRAVHSGKVLDMSRQDGSIV